MPKINAPTVREHHTIVKERLLDATEQILREEGIEALSASAVAAKAGIARNSIYRYVSSVDDLRLLTLARYVPRWRDAVFSRVDLTADPATQLEQFMVANLEQTGESSHSWLMSLMRSRTKGGTGGKASGERANVKMRVANVHILITEFVEEKWRDLGVKDALSWTSFTGSILYSAFSRMEHEADAATLTDTVRRAVRGLIAAATDENFQG